MDRDTAINSLPPTYAAALRLRDRGFDHDAIARALRVEPEAVASLINVAEAKLRRLHDRERPRCG